MKQGKLFFIEIVSFSWVTETIGFFPYKSLYCECYATMPMLADAHISSFGYLYLNKVISSVTKLLYMKAGLKCRNTPKAICSDCRWLRLNQQCFNYCLKLYLVFIVSSRCLVFKRPSAFGLGYVNVPLSR